MSYTIRQLVDATHVSKRRIRYLIDEGLLPKPDRGGRGALYGQVHFERLRQIAELEASGLTLDQIGERLPLAEASKAEQSGRDRRARAADQAPATAPEIWQRVLVAPGVELHVRGQSALLTKRLEWALRQEIAQGDSGGTERVES